MAKDDKNSSFSNVHGSSIVNSSTLRNVAISVGNSPSLPPGERTELQRLLADLEAALEPARNADPQAVRRVERQAEAIAEEISGDKANKSYLEITAQGLKQAAEAVKDIAPTVLEVAGRIVLFISKFGLP